MPHRRLLVFLKAPRPGVAKTRIAATLGDQAALDIHRELVTGTLARIAGSPDGSDVELRFAPDDAAIEIAPWLRPGWRAVPQGGGDLGARLSRAFDDAFADGCNGVVVIGTDCPDLTAADLRAAWDALGDHDVVVGPAQDGGYWLLGTSAPRPGLFADIAWSSSSVLADTLSIARSEGLSVRLLRRLNDIDTAQDWDRHLSNLAAAAAAPSVRE